MFSTVVKSALRRIFQYALNAHFHSANLGEHINTRKWKRGVNQHLDIILSGFHIRFTETEDWNYIYYYKCLFQAIFVDFSAVLTVIFVWFPRVI